MPLLKYYDTVTSQWLPILTGAKGDTGEPGPTGPQGIQGEPGVDGQDGALILVKTQTIGTAVTSVTVNDAFSADYDNYKIIVSGGVGSQTVNPRLQLGTSDAGYSYVRRWYNYAAAENLSQGSNVSNFAFAGTLTTNLMITNLEVSAPFLSRFTVFSASAANEAAAGVTNGIHANSSSFSSFTFFITAGTMTGGTIYVYGYRKG
jgi:hypothetical protein